KMNRTKALGQILNPQSIAVIGGESAAIVVEQCRAIGYSGNIYTVNPRRTDIAGINCVSSVSELETVPDVSFVAAPPEATLNVLRQLNKLGAPGAVCFAAGFAESGRDGQQRQQQLRDAAGDMAVMGPNCHGFLNYLDNVALWPDTHGGHPCDRGVAIVSQSGNIALNLTLQHRSLDIGYVLSVGNCGVLDIHTYIDALLADSRVSVIGLLLETIDDVAAFSEAALRALRQGVPIVAFKNGRSIRGAEITLSHTGSLAGPEKLYAALFKRLGIASCNTLSQFLETMKFLSIVGPLPWATIGSLSCSGGDAAIVADNSARLGLETPSPDIASNVKLQQILGSHVAINNPLDYHTYIWGNYDQLEQCFTEFMSNGYACTLLVLDYPPADGVDDGWQIAEQALVAASEKTGQRAVVAASLPETMRHDVRERLKRAGIAPMQGVEDCLFAIRAGVEIGKAQEKSDRLLPVARRSLADGEVRTLTEAASKRMLADAGISIPAGQTGDAQAVIGISEQLRYPLVLKAVSAELAHKSDCGAVVLNLQTEADLSSALIKMESRYQQFLVEEMLEQVVAELIVGVVRDPVFGLTLLLGSGGTMVELLDDTVSLLLPVRREEIDAALATLKINKLLDGYRGSAGANRGAALDAIEKVIGFANLHANTLVELDINPLVLTKDNAIAVDALIRKVVT
ncbi:MAG: acetate--CoA ligase family protein, partial [Pseudomonadota bacterium]